MSENNDMDFAAFDEEPNTTEQPQQDETDGEQMDDNNMFDNENDVKNDDEQGETAHEKSQQNGSDNNDVYEQNGNDNDSNELPPMAKARMERMEKLEQQRKESQDKRHEQIQEADQFKQQIKDDRTHRIETKMKTNRDQEETFKTGNEEEHDNAWEDVMKYCDLSTQSVATQNQVKDTSRMRKLLLQLKNENKN